MCTFLPRFTEKKNQFTQEGDERRSLFPCSRGCSSECVLNGFETQLPTPSMPRQKNFMCVVTIPDTTKYRSYTDGLVPG
jgi:hypothetical protein